MSKSNEYATSIATLAMLLRHIAPADNSDHRLVLASIKLHQLGNRAGGLAVRFCNGEIEQEAFGKRKDSIYKSAHECLVDAGCESVKIEVGGDPRGYCLKLMHKDLPGNTWGGNESGYGV